MTQRASWKLSRSASKLVTAVGVLGLCFVQHPAGAQELSATPMLIGGESTPFDGWGELVVRLDNSTPQAQKGSLLIQRRNVTSQSEVSEPNVRVPFAMGPNSSALVHLPLLSGQSYLANDKVIELRSEHDQTIGQIPIGLLTSFTSSPFLLDATDPPRVALALDHARIGPHTLRTGYVQRESASGDLILPNYTVGYSAATGLLFHSSQLATLSAPSLRALGNYVIAGGSLAVVITRPEDLRTGPLTTMIGGAITEGPAGTHAAAPGFLAQDPLKRSREAAPERVVPSDAIRKSLRGYSGGNLHDSVFGASATYGLGEVHLLAFDPTQASAIDDKWVRARMLDLVAHAKARATTSLFGLGKPVEGDFSDVASALDPNRASRWAIPVAAILLALYAALAGPVNFTIAARRGTPLRALWVLPTLATAVFFMIVALGMISRGVTDKAKHLSLVDAAAGLSRAKTLRFRSFVTPGSRSLSVSATDTDSILTPPALHSSQPTVLHVERDGLAMTGLTTTPWAPLVIREDAFSDLGQGVSIREVGAEHVTVTNRTGQSLRGVIVIPPGVSLRKAYLFATLKHGETVSTETATPLLTGLHQYGIARDFRQVITTHEDQLDALSTELSSNWIALLDILTTNPHQWWSENAPAVFAQLDGGERKKTDSGFTLESDRVLLRVTGFGGTP